MTRRQQTKAGQAAQRSTLVITNVIKLAGLVLFVREAWTSKDPVLMAYCVVMMSGAQGLEQVAIALIERFFALPDHAPASDEKGQ